MVATLRETPAAEVRESVAAAQAGEFSRFFARYSAYRERLRFRSEDGSGRCDLFGVAPGMLMLVVDVAPTRAFRACLHGQDIVEFHFRLSGSLSLAGRWGELRMADDPSLLLWYQPVGCDDVEEYIGARTGARERWVSLYCDTQWLLEGVGVHGNHALQSLVRPAATAEAPRYRLLPDLGSQADLLRDIVCNPHEKQGRDTYARHKALQLLTETVGALQTSVPTSLPGRRPAARDRRGLYEARDILRREFVDPPDLPGLARRVGLSITKLCAGFVAEFGEPTSAFVRRRRLERAHALLADRERQVCDIANEVGYRHHSTFTAAYARHFGRPPRQARNRRHDG